LCISDLAGTLAIRTPFGIPLIVAANAAAYYDVQENRLLNGVLTDAATAVPREPSLKKWAFVFGAFLLMAPALVPRRGAIFWRTLGLTGAAFALVGGVEVCSLSFTRTMAARIGRRSSDRGLCSPRYFWYVSRAGRGLLPALDRPAATRWLAGCRAGGRNQPKSILCCPCLRVEPVPPSAPLGERRWMWQACAPPSSSIEQLDQ
jgi:hypothetical protein